MQPSGAEGQKGTFTKVAISLRSRSAETPESDQGLVYFFFSSPVQTIELGAIFVLFIDASCSLSRDWDGVD